jgi:iron complex transport system substrate-binding protein
VGAGDRVVGRSRYCDWPPEAARLPVVGGFADVDYEAVLELAPDLVVGAPGPAADRLAGQLAPRGVATWFPPNDSLAAIDAMLLGMGERTGHAADASRVVDELHGREREVERAVAAEPSPRVLFLVAVAPVPVAAGSGSFADELLARARAVNAVAGGRAWQKMELERIVELDPDVVVDASVGAGDAAVSSVTPQSGGWRDVRAVREGRVVPLGDSRVLRPGPRVAEGLAVLARALHPGAAVPVR